MLLIKRTKGGRTMYATGFQANGHITGLSPIRSLAAPVGTEDARRTLDRYDQLAEDRPAEAANYGLLEAVEID